MTTIKPIEACSVHQIQSGQVIVDLCSVVKELVENSLDAGATSVEVRFKNNGLDSIEVHDNGGGISPSNYESLALKHHTSKLASYDDLSSLQTFGFRGEALSSLCALSTFSVITALAEEAPKGKRLEFESSGKLRGTTVVAAQKGTIAVVEGLFEQLPVRRKELTKNIKNQYGKVLGLLHAYACVCTNVKFTVKSAMPKGKNATVFATKGNPTTRENIANIYGTKTLSALVPLDLQLEFQRRLSQKDCAGGPASKIVVRGHISRPVFGDGRQTPDRQMFYVNGRPCGLPQISKAFNEVYKSFNVSQSPFIFANLEMDTNAYDVNVSPDKRTIMLHDSSVLVETLKTCLTELFDQQEQTMPQSQVQTSRLPAYKQLKISRESTVESIDSNSPGAASLLAKAALDPADAGERTTFLHDYFTDQARTREEPKPEGLGAARSRGKKKLVKVLVAEAKNAPTDDENDDVAELRDTDKALDCELPAQAVEIRVRDFNLRMAEQQTNPSDQRTMPGIIAEKSDLLSRAAILSSPQTNAIQNAFDKIRPTRPAPEIATITVGDKTITTMVGTPKPAPNAKKIAAGANDTKTTSVAKPSSQAFSQRLIGFAAPGVPSTQVGAEPDNEAELLSESQDLESSNDGSTSERAFPTASAEGRSDGNSDEDAENDEGGPVDSPNYDTDGDYVDETEKKAREDATVTELIRAAEEKAASFKVNTSRRGNQALKSGSHRDSTVGLQIRSAISIQQIQELTNRWELSIKENPRSRAMLEREDGVDDKVDAEERLALTVSKADFSSMHIVGQFNLGFILAVRPSSDARQNGAGMKESEELFIVDQHASDEKYNFERLQRETVVGNQRLVRPKQLDLTAVEEEILIENSMALEKNGFLIHIDTEGEEAIGQRCRLISLPLSKEVTFGLEDLEELLHLLAESPGLSQSSMVPRPSKVRKMFAMRACRSSIMIGKALSENKMRTIVSHMGEIEKPWNCPHGRPTMRHLMTLSSIEPWQEGDGISGVEGFGRVDDIWSRYVQDE
jgi:DNA mismatch repair protein PMS2